MPRQAARDDRPEAGYWTLPGTSTPVRMWVPEHEVEPAAVQQARNVAALPWTVGLAVMPDVHLGYGACVGSVVAMAGAVSPSAVGVDIGCGMAAVRTSVTADRLPDDLSGLRAGIEATIPVGFASHDSPVDPQRLPGLRTEGWTSWWGRFAGLHPGVADREAKASRQLGTLGGGNHFIEVCVDDAQRVWLMLHSGSRNIGKELAERHIARATTLPHNQDLPKEARNLAVFLAGTPELAAYRNDLWWAQEYATRNREVMLALLRQAFTKTLAGLAVTFDEVISCHHNYVAEERWDGQDLLVTRKGAIRAESGELGIIPGSMGTGSFIVRGLGNPDAFASASHGAGRRMSRADAKRQYTIADVVAQTAGVESRKDAGIVDEIPAAYKDIHQVIAAQQNLVEVVHHLTQIVCVKG